MSRTLIQDIVTLTKEGWRPYTAEPTRAVYEMLDCKHFLQGQKSKPYWFVREDMFCCVGCGARCTLTRPAGFPLPLPMPVKYQLQSQPYTLTPAEMVARKPLLTARQASYCLNVSERQIYDWIAEGRLIKLKIRPTRVRSQEIADMMRDFDE